MPWNTRHTYLRDTNVKSFQRGPLARLRTRPVNVVPTRSSRNLGNFFRIFLLPPPPLRAPSSTSLHSVATGNCANFLMRMLSESQSCGFGRAATSKLLLFPDLESSLSSFSLTALSYMSCNINFRGSDSNFYRAVLSNISILIFRTREIIVASISDGCALFFAFLSVYITLRRSVISAASSARCFISTHLLKSHSNLALLIALIPN